MRTYDLVGVGIGPFNLALAALAERVDGLSALFLEEKPEFSWHPGLLLEGTSLQVPFLADLVTLADPTNPWSFLSYLRAHDRLFPFYLSERFHVPRREYDHYCRWVAAALASCRFGAGVSAVRWDGTDEVFIVEYADRRGDAEASYQRVAARNVVLGIGTEPAVPTELQAALGPDVFHAAGYLGRRAALQGARDVTVVGAGQSGAEVFLDLLRAQEAEGWALRWLSRSPAFTPMEYSKLGLEQFTPDYVRHFRGLPAATRERLLPAQWQLYKAISADTIAAIHDLLYERGIGGAWPDAVLAPGVSVDRIDRGGGRGGRLTLRCRHTGLGAPFTVSTDRVVLATGYVPRRPAFLAPMAHLIRWDPHGRYQVDGDYRAALAPGVAAGLYVQNAELHTHGVGAPDLGLGAYRAAVILNAVTGRSAYPLPRRTAFTTFGVPGAPADPGTGPAAQTAREEPRVPARTR
ncbi:MAG: lysine N(6)-hydroxylase/L-ornithine N(5)-oxygenase family protein [Streptomycetales bacterium]